MPSSFVSSSTFHRQFYLECVHFCIKILHQHFAKIRTVYKMKMRKCARKFLYATPTNSSMLPQIIIIPSIYYVVDTINRRSAYRESLVNHNLCHVSLQLKLCYGLQKISQQECLGALFAWESVLQILLAH